MLAVPRIGWCQSAREQVQREITRLQEIIGSEPDSDQNWAQFKPEIVAILARANSALASQRIFMALEELGNADVELGAGESVTAGGTAAQRMLAFEAEWKRAGSALSDLEKRYGSASPGARIPAAVRALAEANLGQSRHLYEASLPYARATTIGDGLYYLGQARGAAEFAVFCAKLDFGVASQPPGMRSVEPEIAALEARIQSAYQPPLSLSHHREFIQISASVKTARELDDAKLYYGALYEYLPALRNFAALVLPSPGEQRIAAFQSDLAHARESFSSSGADSSIAELFLEQLSASLPDGQDAGSNTARWKTPVAILDSVIPAYLATLRAPVASAPAVAPVVTVTLVRWPYT